MTQTPLWNAGGRAPIRHEIQVTSTKEQPVCLVWSPGNWSFFSCFFSVFKCFHGFESELSWIIFKICMTMLETGKWSNNIQWWVDQSEAWCPSSPGRRVPRSELVRSKKRETRQEKGDKTNIETISPLNFLRVSDIYIYIYLKYIYIYLDIYIYLKYGIYIYILIYIYICIHTCVYIYI